MDYRRNEDKLCISETGYNRLISLDITEESDVEEPVTLQQAKDHLRVTFSDDDAYLTMLIKACRGAIERYTGVSIVEHQVSLVLDNNQGSYALPYGPVVGTANVSNGGEAVSEARFLGGKYPVLMSPYGSEYTVTYTTGYDPEEVPNDLKLAILHEVAYQYEHRGDEWDKEQLSPIAKGYAKRHRRVSKIL